MANNPNQKHFHRHSIRLPAYDYSDAGSYFITLLTHGRESIFGKIIDEKVRLTQAGRIIWEVWKTLPERYSSVELDAAIVMPNHFHAIITINDVSEVRAIHELPLHQPAMAQAYLDQGKSEREKNRINRRRMLLPKVVGYFKMQTGKKINELRNTPGQPVWHRNYYEHIICNDEEFETISDYIEFNPSSWGSNDEYFPKINQNK
ncbi:MAG: hypothetical protein Q8R87_02115 [Anaerolineaceae bacterium]|jgi:REP element-mobilizing transposase RayT|nr:hypothetical protein [Anaerolineaceae bacterium]